MNANTTNKIRKSVYRRDGYRCALCDYTRHLQIHHVVPRGQGGPRDNVMNMICLCSDCHAMVHGIDLRGWTNCKEDREMYQEDAKQCIIEYLADYYAGEGYLWNPWAEDPEAPELNLLDHRNHPRCRDELPLTREEHLAWEHLKGGG